MSAIITPNNPKIVAVIKPLNWNARLIKVSQIIVAAPFGTAGQEK